MNQQYNVAIAHPRISVYIGQTMLRLIQSFNVDDFIQPRSHLAEIRLYAAESEELTRLMLLKLVHLTHIIGLDQSTIHFLTNHFTAVQHVHVSTLVKKHILVLHSVTGHKSAPTAFV